MKSVFFVFIMLAINTASIAQWGGRNNGNNYSISNSTLIVSIQNNNNFEVSIDNQPAYQSRGSYVSVQNLTVGNHNIIIYQWRKNLFGQRRQEVFYNQWIYIKPNTNINLTIDVFGRPNITEQSIQVYNNNGNNEGGCYNDNERKNKRRKHFNRKSF